MKYVFIDCAGLQPVLSTDGESQELDNDDNDNGKQFHIQINNKTYVKGAICIILNIQRQ